MRQKIIARVKCDNKGRLSNSVSNRITSVSLLSFPFPSHRLVTSCILLYTGCGPSLHANPHNTPAICGVLSSPCHPASRLLSIQWPLHQVRHGTSS